jgi:two-component system chemotaxis sensor kinase CheA
MNLVGELITDRNHLYQLRAYFEQEKRGNGAADRLAETVTHLGRITDQLQEEVMSIRMLPVGSVFHKFPRMGARYGAENGQANRPGDPWRRYRA